jgi:dihydrofolate reductase
MSRITASFLMSLDGVVESPQDWNGQYFDERMGAIIGESIASTDAFVMGRRTYEEWAAFWPHQDSASNPMAAAINGLPKHVASTTLARVDWEGSTLIERDVPRAVAALKDRYDRDISISGSATLVRSLLRAGVLDELRVMIHPIALGRGARLFEDGIENLGLELVSSEALSSGVIYAVYRPVAQAG